MSSQSVKTRASAKKDQSGGSGTGVPPKKKCSKADQSGVQYCVSCTKVADDSVVGCDTCERWVCNTVMCSSLPQQLLDAINDYEGDAITFICIQCRIARQGSPTKASQTQMIELVGQLFQQIQGICTTLQGLTDKVTFLTNQPQTSHAEPAPTSTQHPPSQVPTKPAEEYRAIIRDEVKEMREREKRRQSVIVKGLKAKTGTELSSKFGHMTGEMMGTEINLSDIAAIPNHPDVFRTKITNEDHRKLVLEKAKSLRDTSFHSVYVSRDLTFVQRSELFHRRKSRRTEQDRGGSGMHSRLNTIDDGPVPAINSVPRSTTAPDTQGN